MLFVVTLAEVEELLTGTIKIWHVLHFCEHLYVLSEGDHCDKSCNLFDRVGITLNVTVCEKFQWGLQLRSQVPTKKN